MGRRSPGERELDDLLAEGIAGAAPLSMTRTDAFEAADGTPVVTGFDDDGLTVLVPVAWLASLPNLRGPFGAYAAARARSVKSRSVLSELRNLAFFGVFLNDSGRNAIGLSDVSDPLLDAYRDWLDDYEKRRFSGRKKPSGTIFPTSGGGRLLAATKLAYMGGLLSALRMLRVDARWGGTVSPDLDLVRGSDWATRGSRRKPVRILTRPQLKALVRVCRGEVAETTRRLEAAWSVIDEAEEGRRDDHSQRADRELVLEVARLHVHFDGRPPLKKDLGSRFAGAEHPFPRLRRLKPLEYNAALSLLYPSGRLLIPFLLLFAIYYRYNRSVVTTLKRSHFSEQLSPHGPRLRGMPFKNRSGRTQYASWPVTDAPHNPGSMLDLLSRWTRTIRANAPPVEREHLFLARVSSYRTRSLASEPVLNLNLVRFLADHQETIGARFTLQSLRPTVINLVHHLFDGDLWTCPAKVERHLLSWPPVARTGRG